MECGSFVEGYRWQCACAGTAYSGTRMLDAFSCVDLGLADAGSKAIDASWQREKHEIVCSRNLSPSAWVRLGPLMGYVFSNREHCNGMLFICGRLQMAMCMCLRRLLKWV